jgi:phosphatidate cytidylyltransferase
VGSGPWPLVAILILSGGLLMLIEHGWHRPPPARRRADRLKFGIFVLLMVALLGAASLGRWAAAPLLVAIAAAGAGEIHRSWRFRCRLGGSLLAALLLLLALAHLLVGHDWAAAFSLTVLFVATGDAFAQLWGRLLGSHRLCPRLSPGKTVEGLLGGIASAAGLAALAAAGQPGLPAGRLMLLAAVTVAGGTAGDLVFSGLKRAAGIKDFSRLLPGQGGVLDRFDSLILAAPVFHWMRPWLLG